MEINLYFCDSDPTLLVSLWTPLLEVVYDFYSCIFYLLLSVFDLGWTMVASLF